MCNIMVFSMRLAPWSELDCRTTSVARWHGRRPSAVTAVDLHRRSRVLLMRHVLRRVKPAVRIREEQELQSCHGVDQRASAGKPILP